MFRDIIAYRKQLIGGLMSDALGNPSETSPTQNLADALIDLLRLSRTFADAEMTHLNQAQYALLSRLYERKESTLTGICQDLGYDLSVLSRQAGTLIEQGLVVRTKDPHDRRAWKISLTDLGRSRFACARQRRTELLNEALAPYSDNDREIAAQILTGLNNVLIRTLRHKGVSLG